MKKTGMACFGAALGAFCVLVTIYHPQAIYGLLFGLLYIGLALLAYRTYLIK
jgi:hypothetical protein